MSPEGISSRHRHGVTFMPTLLLGFFSVLTRVFGLRRMLLTGSVLMGVALLSEAVWGQDFVRTDQQVARSWTLHRIAVIQAKSGDVVGAKNTVAEITESQCAPGPSAVTSVRFCNGVPLYCYRPGCVRPVGSDASGWQYYRDRSPARVPSRAPQGLPANYLAVDPRHGAVVDFRDESDSSGTRVTFRRYADGYTMIETPHPAKNGG
jgi:hypothetical protein